MASLTQDKQFKYEHVKPENVNGRFINAELLKDSSTTLLVHEFIHDRDDSILTVCPSLYKTYTLTLPEELFDVNDRILGKLICIGLSGSFFVFQYSTISDKFTKFLLADVENDCVLPFSDNLKYFLREYALLEYAPLQCVISGNGQHCLLCLSTRTLRENAKSVIVEILFDTSKASIPSACKTALPPISTLEVAWCKQWYHRANKYTNIISHPLEHNHVITIQTNPCTGKVSIQMDKYRYFKEKSDQLSASDKPVTVRMFDKLYNMLDDDDLAATTFFVEQINPVCSRSGDIVCVCCLVRQNEPHAFDESAALYVSILLLDSLTFQTVASYTTKINKTEQCVYAFDYLSMVIPVFSRYDTEISAWCTRPKYAGTDFKRLVTHKIRREPNLKWLCRSVIIQHTKTSDVGKLDLPVLLKNFLSFIS